MVKLYYYVFYLKLENNNEIEEIVEGENYQDAIEELKMKGYSANSIVAYDVEEIV